MNAQLLFSLETAQATMTSLIELSHYYEWGALSISTQRADSFIYIQVTATPTSDQLFRVFRLIR